MPAGRPKKPTQIKKLNGTFREDRALDDEMMPSKLSFAPSPPDLLSMRGKTLWASVCAELAELEMLHRVDLEQIAAYCSEMDGYWTTVSEIQDDGAVIRGVNKEGNPYVIQNPLIGIKNTYLKNATAIASKFGFSPADRTKIAAPPAERDGSFEAMRNMDDDD